MARWWPQTRWSIRELPELAHLPESERERAFAWVAGRLKGWHREGVIWAIVGVSAVAAGIVAKGTRLVPPGWHGTVTGAVAWSVALACSLLKDRAVLRVLRRENGFCVRCGYDLRATPDRCPECGTVPDEAKANAKAPSRQGAPREDEDAGS